MRRTLAVNRAHPASSIQDATWTTRLDAQDGTRRSLIYCHPMVATMTFIAGNVAGAFAGQRALVEAMAKTGYTVGGSDLGYYNTNGWGNTDEQMRIGQFAAWARTPLASGGLGGSTTKPLVAVGISAGMMGLVNYFGQAGDPADVAAFVFILPPYDAIDIYTNNLGGARAAGGQAWGVTYPTPLPPHASPKENIGPLAGKPVRIYYATDDPLNGASVVADMLTAIGPTASAVSLGALGHTEAAINAVDKDDVANWLRSVGAAP